MLDFFGGGSEYDDWFGPHDFTGAGGGGGGGGWETGFPVPDVNIDIGVGGGGGGGGAAPNLNQTLTQIVDGYEYQLKANLAQFQSGAKSGSAAVETGWQLMNAMVSACLRYGAAGQKAAAERDRRIAPQMVRWDWIAYYIDPITGGNTALPPVPGGGVNVNQGLLGGGSNMTLILLVLVAVILLKE